VKLKKIAELVGGELAGGADVDIRGVALPNEATSRELIFILESKGLAEALKSQAGAVVAPVNTKIKDKPAVLVKNPRLAMAKILTLFAPKPGQKIGTIHKTAVIAPTAKLGQRVTIYPHVTIGDQVEIGDDCIIYPSATLYDRVKLGQRVIIHAGACLGVDGYGFVWANDHYEKIPQIGQVVVEDDCEIYANVCIARGTIGATRIGAGTKIDNLTHVAHNCVFGQHCAITALVGFAGSVTFQDHVSVGGMAGFNGHITIGENTVVMGKAGVTKDLPANSVVSGFPATQHKDDLEMQAALRRLPEILKQLKNQK